ncbi:hypothetical protein GGS23DRAFT_28085 [Durotheca rogersii]|uniref:uncharacterized protein n=1 Tax=Durotheca rogersii TaxID=419775 RepID=UPI00221FC4CB|nr:uncharacterized protein GGS23DRAFT_28085 [Durotheca rogersii]KAI5868402.1 hypothetical protein GGS23DRAFT_28085 [Durotheca rogersii]
MFALQSLFFLAFPALIAGTPVSTALAARALPGNFVLFAYGEGIGGVPIFTSGGQAFLGNSSKVDDAEAAPVEFSSGTGESLVGSPNATAPEKTPTWSNLTLVIPKPEATLHQVEFTNSTPGDNVSASGFVFYGYFLLHKTDTSLNSMWYAIPSEHEDVWSLGWNSTGEETEGTVLLTLKATEPSQGTSPTL